MLYRLTLEVSLCYPSKELHSTFLCGGPFTVKYCVIMNRTSSLYYIQSITDHGRYSQLGRTWGSREAKSKNNDKRASSFDGSRILPWVLVLIFAGPLMLKSSLLSDSSQLTGLEQCTIENQNIVLVWKGQEHVFPKRKRATS